MNTENNLINTLDVNFKSIMNAVKKLVRNQDTSQTIKPTVEIKTNKKQRIRKPSYDNSLIFTRSHSGSKNKCKNKSMSFCQDNNKKSDIVKSLAFNEMQSQSSNANQNYHHENQNQSDHDMKQKKYDMQDSFNDQHSIDINKDKVINLSQMNINKNKHLSITLSPLQQDNNDVIYDYSNDFDDKQIDNLFSDKISENYSDDRNNKLIQQLKDRIAQLESQNSELNEKVEELESKIEVQDEVDLLNQKLSKDLNEKTQKINLLESEKQRMTSLLEKSIDHISFIKTKSEKKIMELKYETEKYKIYNNLITQIENQYDLGVQNDKYDKKSQINLLNTDLKKFSTHVCNKK